MNGNKKLTAKEKYTLGQNIIAAVMAALDAAGYTRLHSNSLDVVSGDADAQDPGDLKGIAEVCARAMESFGLTVSITRRTGYKPGCYDDVSYIVETSPASSRPYYACGVFPPFSTNRPELRKRVSIGVSATGTKPENKWRN